MIFAFDNYLLDTERGDSDRGVYATFKVSPTGKENSPEAIKIAGALSALFEANRKKMLADWYLRYGSAPATAPEVERGVDAAVLNAGVNPGDVKTAITPL